MLKMNKISFIAVLISLSFAGKTNGMWRKNGSQRTITLFTAPTTWKSNTTVTTLLKTSVYSLYEVQRAQEYAPPRQLFSPKPLKQTKFAQLKHEFDCLMSTPIDQLRQQLEPCISPTARLVLNGFSTVTLNYNIHTLKDLQNTLSDNLRAIFRKFTF